MENPLNRLRPRSVSAHQATRPAPQRCNSWTGANSVLAYETLHTSSSTSPRSERRARVGSAQHDQMDLLRVLSNHQVPAVPQTAGDVLQLFPSAQLFEYLCVCGLPRPSSATAPVVLATVPPDKAPDPLLPQYVFADHAPQYRTVTADLPEMKQPWDEVRSAANTFMFCMNNEEDRPLYVFAARVWELLEEPAAWIPRERVRGGSLIGGRHITERVYCIVSKNPHARLFWQFLWELGRHENQRLTTDDDKTRERSGKRACALIRILSELSTRIYPPGHELVIESKSCFQNEFIRYQLPGPTHSLRLSIACTCLPVLLRALSPDLIATTMCGLLTEASVIVVGRQLGRVSACVLALASIIAPFAWVGLLWPLLPHTLHDYMASPVPYLAGCITASEQRPEQIDIVAGSRVLIVCIDTNRVHVHGAMLPLMPCSQELSKSLQEAHMRLRSNCNTQHGMCEDRRPFDSLDVKSSAYLMSAIEALSQYTVWLIGAIRRALPNADKCENGREEKEAVLRKVKRVHRDFVRAVLETQQWAFLSSTTFDALPLTLIEENSAYRECSL